MLHHYILFATTLLLSLQFTPSSSLPLRNDFIVTGLEDIEPAFGDFQGEMFAGHVPTSLDDSEDETKLMFWLYTCTKPTNNNALVIWLNGGPGCSSFGGMMFENAPVTIPHYPSGKLYTSANPPLLSNPYSWTLHANMLYVEQPAKTGFSTGRMPRNETDVANDFHGFLTNFYQIFPEMLDKQLYIFGESYAGMYVPSIARKIYNMNQLQPQETQQIPLAGIALGNGWMDASVQGPAIIDYAWWHGMIDSHTRDTLHQQFEQCYKYGKLPSHNHTNRFVHKFTTPDECGIMEAVQAAAGKGVTPTLTGPNIYDVTTWDSYPFIFDENGTFHRFFNNPRVQQLIHAPQEYWHLCLPGEGRRRRLDEKMLDHDQPVSVVPYVAELLDKANIRVLIYNGDRDMSCCAQGREELLNDMKWSGSDEWKTNALRGVWLVDEEPAGYSRKMKNLEFVVVYNSGHLVPMNQPKRALDLLWRMVNGASFNDKALPTFDEVARVNSTTTATAEAQQQDEASLDDETNSSLPKACPKLRRRHTGFLILFSLAIGFVGGIIVSYRYSQKEQRRQFQEQRRQQYAEVPMQAQQQHETTPLVGGGEAATTKYPWRWWSSHQGAGGGTEQNNTH